jgi:hypothetical protein
MASKKWIGGSSSDPTTAGNWSPSGVPADSDDIIFDGDAESDLAGADQSSIEPATIRIYKSCSVSIGSGAAPWKIGPALLEAYLPDENGGNLAGPPSVVIDCTAEAVAAFVFDAQPQGADGFSCVRLRGTAVTNSLAVMGGSVSVGAIDPGEASTWAQIDVSGDNSTVMIGFGCTLTTLNQRQGTIFLNAAATTVNQDGGTLQTAGSGAITTFECRGNLIANATGAITTLNIAGSGAADFSQSPAERTVSNCTLYGSECRLNLDNNAYSTGAPVVTMTNGIDLRKGARSSQVTSPTELTMSLAAV